MSRVTQTEVDELASDGKRRELRAGHCLVVIALPSGKRTYYARRTRQGATRQRRIGDAAVMPLDEARRQALATDLFAAPPEAVQDPLALGMQRELAALREDVADLRGDVRMLLSKLVGAQAGAFAATGEVPEPLPLSTAALAPVEDPNDPQTVAAFVKRHTALKEPTHAWASAARCHVLPQFGARHVASLDPKCLARHLNQIDSDVNASRARIVLRDVCRLAAADGALTGPNPAGEVLKALLRKRTGTTTHHVALAWQELPTAYAALGDDMLGLCARFTLLTAARPGEARNACWSEINLDNATWEIPGERMKSGKGHRVPLSGEALRVLRRAASERVGTDLVFPNAGGGKAVYQGSVARALKDAADDPSTTLHGTARSAFSTWAKDTGVPWEVTEHCLAHAVGGSVERSYQRSDLFEQRVPVMEAWAEHLTGEA